MPAPRLYVFEISAAASTNETVSKPHTSNFISVDAFESKLSVAHKKTDFKLEEDLGSSTICEPNAPLIVAKVVEAEHEESLWMENWVISHKAV